MNQQVNATAPQPTIAQAAERAVETPKDAAQRARDLLDAQVRLIVGTVIRGLLVSAPGVQPVDLLNSICRETGNLVAGAVNGDIAAVLNIRSGFKKNFEFGVKKAPLLQQQTGIPPRPVG